MKCNTRQVPGVTIVYNRGLLFFKKNNYFNKTGNITGAGGV